jgi:hypothetical protein
VKANIMANRPDTSEAPEYYYTYINQAVGDDIRTLLHAQTTEVLNTLSDLSEERSFHRYAADKWSIREVVGHVNDCERLFTFRAFWFARGFESPLPSFDQNIAVAHAGAEARTLRSHLAEFASVRAATLTFVDHLPDDAWSRTGIASGKLFSVRAMTYLLAGHAAHHLRILREQYL